ncbi:hypothetical protein L2E82_11885 [Cichorium intybus]|uniref:Uncharacterized protein n=1 Tax=Cichorium intybus TaxID=13427 RepID=A0ACB9GF95_CICIN|nr:hypothetical protein L2E82_11885 [Cichorium intybus]
MGGDVLSKLETNHLKPQSAVEPRPILNVSSLSTLEKQPRSVTEGISCREVYCGPESVDPECSSDGCDVKCTVWSRVGTVWSDFCPRQSPIRNQLGCGVLSRCK